MATLQPSGKQQYHDESGAPLVGGRLYTYDAGTTTPRPTYADSAGAVPNTNPVVLDARGEATVFWSGAYKVVLKDADDALVWAVDGVTSADTLPNSLDAQLRADLASAAAGKGSELMGHIAAGAGSAQRTVQGKLRERLSVLDFGADPTGAAYSTAAFNALLATGRRGFVPAGTYRVADVGAVAGMDIEGEGKDCVTLLVGESGAGAFTHPGGADLLGVRLTSMTIRAADGVTGARAWKQADCSKYTAFAYFELETWADLEVSFEGFFIYTRWTGRDGFHGTPPNVGSPAAPQKHTAITSIPAVWGQDRLTNLNRCERFFMFRSSNNAAVDIAYGVNWTFSKCGWENMTAPAIRARGIFGGEVRDSWCELMATPSLFVLGVSPAPNAQGSRPWTFRGNLADLASTSFRYVSIAGACSASVIDCTFINVPTGVLLTDGPTYLDEQYGNKVISGAGFASFLAGARARRGSIEFTGDVINAPVTANQNVLPIGPSGLGQANFSVSGITAKADVASAIGLAGQAVQFTLSGSGNAASYLLPAKLAEFLKGKTVTLAIAGYAGSADVMDGVAASIWDSVLPNYGAGTIGAQVIDAGDARLQIAYVTATVAGDSTALRVGLQVGGANSGKTFVVESMALYIGEIKPAAMSFK